MRWPSTDYRDYQGTRPLGQGTSARSPYKLSVGAHFATALVLFLTLWAVLALAGLRDPIFISILFAAPLASLVDLAVQARRKRAAREVE
jgi:hypothetical protein